MSSTTALGVTPDRRPIELAEYRNAWGWSPNIWGRFGIQVSGYDGPKLTNLWRSIEDLPSWQQIPVLLTFDTGVIPWQAYAEAADLLDQFDSEMPCPTGHANHVPAVAELLRSAPEVPLFGVYGTSVSENPFDPWDEDADDHGSGIPLSSMYVLERHRHLLPQTASR